MLNYKTESVLNFAVHYNKKSHYFESPVIYRRGTQRHIDIPITDLNAVFDYEFTCQNYNDKRIRRIMKKVCSAIWACNPHNGALGFITFDTTTRNNLKINFY